jgi:hypothetical protein
MMSIGLSQAEQTVEDAIVKLSQGDGVEFKICRGLNISQCEHADMVNITRGLLFAITLPNHSFHGIIASMEFRSCATQ